MAAKSDTTITVTVTSDTEALLADHQHTNSEDENATETKVEPHRGQGVKHALGKCWRHPITNFLRNWWRLIVIVLTPLVLAPLPIFWRAKAANAAYAIGIIAVYWVTEVVPIAGTSLLPVILFPALGVLSAEQTAINYLRDSNMLLIGGLMMAVAIEKWNLHKRMALLVLLVVGSKPVWLLLGFMGTTAFISMWISNTATAAMMVPIAHALLEEMRQESEIIAQNAPKHSTDRDPAPSVSVRYAKTYNNVTQEDSEQVFLELSDNETDDEMQLAETNATLFSREEGPVTGGESQSNGESQPHMSKDLSITVSHHRDDLNEETNFGTPAKIPEDATPDRNSSTASNKRFQRLSKGLMLGVAYAANIGGTATLTGTGPNIVLNGETREFGVNFGLWFVFATPAMILALIISWVYLSLLYCDDSFKWCRRKLCKRKVYSVQSKKAKQVIREQYKKLGKIRYAEVLVLILFILLALLWLFREPKFIPGWGSFFESEENGASYFSDASTVLFVVFLLFVIPSRPCCCSNTGCIKAGSSPRLLDWNSVQHKLPWNVVVFFGSGFAIAEAAKQSELSAWLGKLLLVFSPLPKIVIALLVSIIVASVTEVMSNIAATTLFLPVLKQLAINLHIHPLYLMIPAAVSASFAFMIPMSTPPNAIAFSYGYLKVYDMVLTGIPMNIFCIIVVALVLNTTGVAIFGLSSFPDSVVNGTNMTMA